MRRVGLLAVVAALASLGGASNGTAGRISIGLVPIGSFSDPSLQGLASHFERRLGVNVRILPRLPLSPSAWDSSRNQYVADKLLTGMEVSYPGRVVIGITTKDMYFAPFRYAFAARDARAAVVSTARMDPRTYGLPPDEELLYSRIEKMGTRDVGILALHRHESANPRSVLYDSILGLNDLDFMTEAFAPRPYAPDKIAWLAHAKAACTSASAQQSQLAGTPIQTPNDILTVLGKAIDIEKNVLATFQSLKAARGDGALGTKLGSTLTAAVSLDESTLAALTAQWDPARFKQWAAQRDAFSATLGSTSLRLGSKPCDAYFDS